MDGAWYDARVTVQCGALRVMYEGFLEELDEWYDPAALAVAASARDVAALRARFRVRSTPLEDTQCRDLRAGALLCVSCALDGGDLKFYDAVLESVRPFFIPSLHKYAPRMNAGYFLCVVWCLLLTVNADDACRSWQRLTRPSTARSGARAVSWCGGRRDRAPGAGRRSALRGFAACSPRRCKTRSFLSSWTA